MRRLSTVKFSIVAVLLAACLNLATAGVPDQTDGSADIEALGIGANFGKWPGGVVPWVYNPTATPPAGYTDNNTTLGYIEDALEEWEGLCGIDFQRQGSGIDLGANILTDDDNLVVFTWDASIGGAAGQAGPTSDNTDVIADGHWAYVDGTLRMNPAVFDQNTGLFQNSPFQANLIAFNGMMLHELGHLIGLGHSDDPVSRMFANPYNQLPSLRADDFEACQTIYGHADKIVRPVPYDPPGAGANPFNTLEITESSAMQPRPPLSEVTATTTFFPLVEWDINGPFDQEMTALAVDPTGFIQTVNSSQIQCPMGFVCNGSFSISTFDNLRELPGNWTIYLLLGGQVIDTTVLNVTAPLAAWNQPPDATFTYTENPATRQISATVNVTGDTEGNDATIVWHIPTVGVVTEALNASSGVRSQNVTLDDGDVHEIFVEVNDDWSRYVQDDPNNVGPAGPGFRRLFRYSVSNRNQGPDFGGDNSSDVMWRNATLGINWLHTMNGATVSASEAVSTIPSNWIAVGTGDYNADGKSDLLWWDVTTGTRWMNVMNGATTANSLFVINVGPTWLNVGSGDYDGDGDSDLLWQDIVSGLVWMHQLDGSQITTEMEKATNGGTGSGVTIAGVGWLVTGSGDFDGDGDSDIFWRHSGDGRNWIHLMNGPMITGSQPVNQVIDTDWIPYIADFDGDGKSDILWHNPTTGVLWIYLMNGATIATSAAVNTVGLSWGVGSVGDLNGDGKADIFLRDSATGINWAYLMDGATISKSLSAGQVGDTANWAPILTQ